MIKQGFTYIVTNAYNTVFYTGVTKELVQRINEHKKGVGSYFTKKYHLTKLVYYEYFSTIMEAIIREKQIKDLDRKDKIEMILKFNPGMMDLYYKIIK